MGLPNFSIQKPVMTLMVFLVLLVVGFISLLRLPIELFQGQNQGIISIIVRVRGGMPPADVEKNVTKYIEESVSTVSKLKNLYSHTREAESRVTMEFEPGTNMNFAALEIREKFSRVIPLLPKEIEKPIIANYDDAQAAILIFALTSEAMSPEDIRELVEIELKPILARVDGVASVEVYGGRERKILVELDRDKMVAYNISVEKVMDIIGQGNVNLLAGNVDKGTFHFAVRSMGAFMSVDEIGEIGVQATRQGSIISLKEIATVKDSYLEPEDNARLNLEQNVTVYIKKTAVANTIPVARTVRMVLEDFETRYEKSLNIVMVTDKAETIIKAINDVKNALYVGIVLTILIIYAFLRKWVLALVVAIAIPASIVITFMCMGAFKISINVMTLSGLALAIGILVDSAIVILENIFSKKEQGMTDGRAIRVGAEEVWLPLLASLITTIIVFLPVVFIDKKIQLTYSGFAFTVSSSLVASFFVALMLIPVLLMQWARGNLDFKDRPGESFLGKFFVRLGRKIVSMPGAIRWSSGLCLAAVFALFWWQGVHSATPWFGIKSFWNALVVAYILVCIITVFVVIWYFYEPIMKKSLDFVQNPFRALIYIALVGGVSVFAGYKIGTMDIDWPSTYEENEFAVVIFPLAGARLEANDDAVKKVEEVLNKIPDVEMFSSTIRKDDVKIFVRLKPKGKRQYSKDQIMELLDEKGNEMIKEIHDDYSLLIDEGVSSTEEKKLIVNIFGHESDVLEKLAREFAGRMSKVPGLTNLVMTDLRKRPEYSLVVDKGRAAIYGLNVKTVADSVHAQVRGMRPTKFREFSKGEEIEVITRLQAIYRQKVEDLKFVHVQTDDGLQIPLLEYANFYPSTGPTTIDRKDKYRYVFVKGDAKRPLETLAREVEQTLREVPLPDDYYFRFGGSFEELIKGKAQLMMAFILTVLLVYMVLGCMFESYIQPIIVILSVPMAGVGIYLALKVTGKPLSQPVLIGMILLAGYVVNAAIIMVDRMNLLKKSGFGDRDCLIGAGKDRLRPIMMTTCSTVTGFLPLAAGWGQSSDLWSPLAVTVIGGLISSTFLTLFVLPNLIFIAYRFIVEPRRKVFGFLRLVSDKFFGFFLAGGLRGRTHSAP